jgi:hypothetical protein
MPNLIYKYTSKDFVDSKIDPEDPYKFRRIIDSEKFPSRKPLSEKELELISPKQDISKSKQRITHSSYVSGVHTR